MQIWVRKCRDGFRSAGHSFTAIMASSAWFMFVGPSNLFLWRFYCSLQLLGFNILHEKQRCTHHPGVFTFKWCFAKTGFFVVINLSSFIQFSLRRFNRTFKVAIMIQVTKLLLLEQQRFKGRSGGLLVYLKIIFKN